MRKIEKILKNCEYCNKEFLARNLKHRPGRFCSIFCQRKGRNRKKEEIILFKCENCQKEVTRPKRREKEKMFCSVQCMAIVRGQNMRGQNNHKWKGGKKRPSKEKVAINYLKKTIGKCEKCGEKKNLHGHHKIPYSKRKDLCAELENIQILCISCHALEHPELNFIERPIIYRGEKINCKICNKEVYTYQSRKYLKKYCSNECRRIGQNFGAGIHRECNQCKKQYYVMRKNVAISKYCSMKCKGLSRRKKE